MSLPPYNNNIHNLNTDSPATYVPLVYKYSTDLAM